MPTQVVVLTPHGRRQTVNVNQNTTILQIIEEVCKKHGFNPAEYDIKHHNKILDTTSILRFTSLPNNAQLELVAATKSRTEGEVVLGIHLEDGRRFVGNFLSSDSLWDVIKKLCPDELNPNLNTVIIYMRQEIYGIESLKNTNLKSLGITNGRAMLRLIHRCPEVLKSQANVSSSLPVKITEEKPYIRQFIPCENITIQTEKVSSIAENDKNRNISNVTDESKKNQKKQQDFIKTVKQEKSKGCVQQKKAVQEKENKKIEHKNLDENFVFLGKRNAMVFSLETSDAVPCEDLTDDFFDLTVQDAKRIMQDLKKKRLELEEGKLMTSALRNLEESKKQLIKLNKYKKAIIRVQFPDRTVLQGVFTPHETVGSIVEFVREFLEDKSTEFYLYTTPPKEILNHESTLLEIGFIPSAIVHFGTHTSHKEISYLRSDVLCQFSSSSVASLAASKLREEFTNKDINLLPDNLDVEPMDIDHINYGASTSRSDYEENSLKPSYSTQKMPKWFKHTK